MGFEDNTVQAATYLPDLILVYLHKQCTNNALGCTMIPLGETAKGSD